MIKEGYERGGFMEKENLWNMGIIVENENVVEN